MFVRKKHRGRDAGLIMLEDFVCSFSADSLGLRYPLSSFMYTGKLFTDLLFAFFTCSNECCHSISMFVAASSVSVLMFCSSVKAKNCDLFKMK